MRNYFEAEIRLIVLTLVVTSLIGYVFDHFWVGAFLGLCGYILWSLRQIYRLENWLDGDKAEAPPNLWGVFDYLLEQNLRTNKAHSRERKKLQLELIRQRDLMEDVRDSVILTDESSRIIWFNRRAKSMFKLRDPEDLGIPLINIFRSPVFIAYLNKGKFADPIAMIYPPNSKNWIEASITRYKNGNQIILVRDVTRLRRLEEMRRDFIANLSHELRTPLTVLRGYLETLSQHPQSPSEFQKYYGEMSGQSTRMANLLKDLITLSQLENSGSRNPYEKINLQALLQRIANDALASNAYKGQEISLEGEDHIYLQGVETELYSAFSNLAFNAVRYTSADTNINISWKRSRTGLRVAIEDNGPGIEEKHLSRLTERFYRIDNGRNSDSGGTGLGLAIVKHALASHGGKLHIKSIVGEGSTFSCLLPAEAICQNEESDFEELNLSP